jgi:hypothetical protein
MFSFWSTRLPHLILSWDMIDEKVSQENSCSIFKLQVSLALRSEFCNTLKTEAGFPPKLCWQPAKLGTVIIQNTTIMYPCWIRSETGAIGSWGTFLLSTKQHGITVQKTIMLTKKTIFGFNVLVSCFGDVLFKYVFEFWLRQLTNDWV